jgi:hypothetical protein
LVSLDTPPPRVQDIGMGRTAGYLGVALLSAVACLSLGAAGCRSQNENPKYCNLMAAALFFEDQGRVAAGVMPLDEPARLDESKVLRTQACDDHGAELRVEAKMGDSIAGPGLWLTVYVTPDSTTAECEADVTFNEKPHHIRATWVKTGHTWYSTGCQVDGKDLPGDYYKP